MQDGHADDDDARAPTIAQHARASSGGIDDLRAGDIVGRYVLVERLGAGAMGVVWAATDPQLERQVAIKLVHPRLARSADASGRLLREARAMAKLSHRAVVTVHDAGEVDGRLFVAMELVRGTTLGAVLRARAAAADWRDRLAMLLDAGRGLAAAHQAGVLHRDFKPDNVLVDVAPEARGNRGRVCVGDFGLAMLTEESLAAAASQQWNTSAIDAELTTTGALMGTPAYMSPQQLRGEPIDARADQFAFCVATYEAVYGARPFPVDVTGLDAVPVLIAAIEARALPARPSAPAPPAIADALHRGLDPDPDARWPDMEALIAALERARGDRRSAPRRFPIADTALVLAAAVGTWLVVHGDGRAGGPPVRLFELPMQARVALSPDGSRFALGADRLEVRELDGPQQWSAPVTGARGIYRIELTHNEVRFAFGFDGSVHTWRYLEGPTAIRDDRLALGPRAWAGTSALGDLVLATDSTLELHAHGLAIRRWQLEDRVELIAVAPDGKRAAVVEAKRFDGRITLLDLEAGVVARGERMVGLTAIAWRDDAHLVFATGTFANPAIHEVEVTPAGFGPARTLYTQDTGWFSVLAASPHHILYVDAHPTTRARIVTRGVTTSIQDYDRSTVAAALGWATDDEFFVWSRRSSKIERHTLGDRNLRHAVAATSLGLDGEPVNATRADDTLVVALRRPGSRELVALSLATNQPLWRHPDTTFAVRCAGDRHPPCFAVIDGASDRIVAIDPATGVTGKTELFRGNVEDLAVRDDGQRILVATRGASKITELDPTGAVIGTTHTDMAAVRSIAYDPSGGFVFAGTSGVYEVRYQPAAGDPITLMQSEDLLLLVRPSPDGKRVLVLARSFTPDLWLLER